MYSFIRKIYYKFDKNKKKRYIRNLVQKGLKLGENVFFVDSFFLDPSHCFLISIGSNTTICPNVRLIAHDASTKNSMGCTKIGKITIGCDCFIGDSTIILPGVSVGDNSIIGAGSVVTKNVPENHIAAGNPAKVISKTESYLEKMKTISNSKKIFDENYYIHKLDSAKRKEMMDSIGQDIGFIV